MTAPEPLSFPFRPWVRKSCRRAMSWGIGALAGLGVAAWAFRDPGGSHLGRAFGVLLLYGLLFWLSLLKIWWTARRPAVVMDEEVLAYLPLHRFRPRRLPFDRILAAAPRAGTQSLRLVVARPGGGARELFLNLGVVRGKHQLLDLLAERLRQRGLEPVPGLQGALARPGWEEAAAGRAGSLPG